MRCSSARARGRGSSPRAGFRDVLELGRRTRPTPYGLKGSFEPLIPRDLRLEVDERVDAEGQVVVPLAEDQVRERGAPAPGAAAPRRS